MLAALVRRLGDFDLAEDAVQDAFAAAAAAWPADGVPANPARLAHHGGAAQGDRPAAARARRRRPRRGGSPSWCARRSEHPDEEEAS